MTGENMNGRTFAEALVGFTEAEKRRLCGPIVTEEGAGYVCGAKNRFATVQYPDGTEDEYAWGTIDRLRYPRPQATDRRDHE